MSTEPQIQHHTQTGETRCNTQTFGLHETAAHGRLWSGNNEPASVLALTGSSTPLVTTRKEA